MHAPGTTVRIVRNNHWEEGARSFVGETGHVRSADLKGLTVVGLDPDSAQPYWFENDEVEPA